MTWYFAFFLISGFCGILYELVWLRLAMAQFTVTTPFVSIVLSVFMGGLGLGSWAAGRLVGRDGGGLRGLRLYAAAELLIGCSAVLVPLELVWGRALMERMSNAWSLSTAGYYALSGVWIALALTPWCACMGATFPLAMSAIRGQFPRESERSFSYLYLANIGGALAGSAIPLLLIEAWGFHGALRAGMALNLCLAACAFALSLRRAGAVDAAARECEAAVKQGSPESRRLLTLLFATGLTSMGVEVVWVRIFTRYSGTVVYAFAGILGAYMAATFIGSRLYRGSRLFRRPLDGGWLALLGLTALAPLVACDVRLHVAAAWRIALGVTPFSAVAGFLTPMILDQLSRGNALRAGRGYAVNIVGCVAGPLLSGFVLLPLIGERAALAVFAAPWIAASFAFHAKGAARRRRWPGWAAVLALAPLLLARSWETEYRPRIVLRDHTATVVATGHNRFDKQLLVNGVGITNMTPITKMMAHLPLAYLRRQPQSAAVICFGMGTTHRSVLSWGIHSTAVELAPSVPSLFSFFHADGAELLRSPLSRVVVDDGRFFLERTREQYDAVIIDPPPPVQAAASSLLYSKEFYAIARRRLRPGGILQQWLPNGDPATLASVAKALKESFPYLRTFGSVEGWGHHFLGSDSPFPDVSPAGLAARLPARAAADLIEWGPAPTAERQFALVLSPAATVDDLIRQDPAAPALQDDRPINEYYLLRRNARLLRWLGFSAPGVRP